MRDVSNGTLEIQACTLKIHRYIILRVSTFNVHFSHYALLSQG